jgi:hypothetical protein
VRRVNSPCPISPAASNPKNPNSTKIHTVSSPWKLP